MDADQRKARLIELLDRLRNGDDVAPRDLKTVLSKAQFAALQESWVEQQQFRAAAMLKPAAIVEYERRLKKALFEYAKGEGYSGSTRLKQPVDSDGKRPGTRAYRRAETGFEKLIEYLEERITADPGLCIWFDRQLDFGLTGDLGLSPEQMPRAVTSRSVDRRGIGRLVGMRTKREVKQMALEEALSATVVAEELAARVAARMVEEQAKVEQAQREQLLARMQLARNRR